VEGEGIPGLGLLRRLRRVLETRVFLAKEFDPAWTVCIFGSRRSGTTWLLDLVSNVPGYIPIYEPFNPRWYPESQPFHPHPNPKQPTIEEYVSKVVKGTLEVEVPLYDFNLRNLWRRLRGSRLVVKCVRANLLVPLFAEAGVRLCIYLIRNPFAVVSSQLRTGIMPHLAHLHREPKLPLESLLTLLWVGEQRVPLAYSHPRLLKLRYEDVVEEPEAALEEVARRLEVDPSVFFGGDWSKPSRSTRGGIERARNRWRRELTPEQKRNISEALERTGFDYEALTL